MMSEEYTANVNHQEGPSRPGYRSCILALIITCNMEHAGIYNDQSNLLMASLNNTTARWIIQIRVRPHDHIISSGRLWPVLYIWCHYCQRNLIKIQPQTWFGISYDTAASLGRTGRYLWAGKSAKLMKYVEFKMDLCGAEPGYSYHPQTVQLLPCNMPTT